jgi:adenylate kinase
MAARGSEALIVVDIVVPEAELVRRLSTRRICSNCGANADPTNAAASVCTVCGGQLVYRSDDNDRVVLERLRVYRENTQPVVGYYRQRPTFREVNGSQPPDAVGRELESTIQDALRAAAGTPLGARR